MGDPRPRSNYFLDTEVQSEPAWLRLFGVGARLREFQLAFRQRSNCQGNVVRNPKANSIWCFGTPVARLT